MSTSHTSDTRRHSGGDDRFFVTAPSIALPKGGGAIKGIGEKFAANPSNGTGSMSVPIPFSPGRSGFAPKLSLTYDSGAGNGPFGMGWNLGLPTITRKTDKGLPLYDDGHESDVFILSGAEDLVPALDGSGVPLSFPPRTVNGVTYHVQRYRPRVEGLFARIEKWTDVATGETHWRTITRDNVTTLYGSGNNSRIVDPADPNPSHPTRIFSWLICESYDDRGNWILYEYKAENSDGVNLGQANEHNRTAGQRATNRHLKRIRYGNRMSRLVDSNPAHADWMFDAVFDYGEHDPDLPTPDDAGQWGCRQDPFSIHRATFEVRTYRLCRRVLMFHHFPELPVDPCLVRSLAFNYQQGPVVSFMTDLTESGHVWDSGNGSYTTRSFPPVEFTYTQAEVDSTIRIVDAASLGNLPRGLDNSEYQWVDLDGEGTSGILSEQGTGWFYKPNLSPANLVGNPGSEHLEPRFGASALVATKPNDSLSGAQLLDLAGDGSIDLVRFGGAAPGFYERTDAEGWQTLVPFQSLPSVSWDDPNLKFVDLTGDGHADILITENEVFVWYPSLGEAGFGPDAQVQKVLDEERGPQLVVADGTQSIYLADMSGDGLQDLVRIRNGEVCYWPNSGYGRFGAKVTMDNSPWFDVPDLFEEKRIRLADIDGSGSSDIIYLDGNGIVLHFNQAGNSWSSPVRLDDVPRIDDLTTVTTVDLLGNGTTCLVWSSPHCGDAERPMRYIDLMGGEKPHLLVGVVNNLGAETRIQYAPSTRFSVADRIAGRPWITRIPFPVQVVERVETDDRISGNRFITRYAYHHGHFDGVEREFRGFGMVEQWDTEEFAALRADGQFPSGTNIDAQSHVPPILTKTWFHTGVFFDRNHVSDYFAGLENATDAGEYFREPGLNDAQARDLLLADSVLPGGLTAEEERQACRALKGSMLRREVYGLDGSPKENIPYTVTEQNYTLRRIQPMSANRYAVFHSHENEAISYHYERDAADPRIGHTLTLEVDDVGNVRKTATIGYGRRTQVRVPDGMGGYTLVANPGLQALNSDDQAMQTAMLVTYLENSYTNSIDTDDVFRLPMKCESVTYELTGYTPSGPAGFMLASDLVYPDGGGGFLHLYDSEIQYEEAPGGGRERRPIEHVRTQYRPDDLGTAASDPLALLPLGTLESMGLEGESYRLAFTAGLLKDVFQRPRTGGSPTDLLPSPKDVLPADIPGGNIVDRGGYVDLDSNGNWWIPSGRSFYSPNIGDTPAQELTNATNHFYLTGRYRDPFGVVTTVKLDGHDLLVQETCDAFGNRVTAGERDPNPLLPLVQQGNDYRVLHPVLVMNPNRNRTVAAFDALGMVVGTAVMGKPEDMVQQGDTIGGGFVVDLSQSDIDALKADPAGIMAATLLDTATTRIVYDVGAYYREPDPNLKPPTFVITLVRETHYSQPIPPTGFKIQVSLTYSDGFGREVQKKIQAEPGPVPTRDGSGHIIIGGDGLPVMTAYDVDGRWVGSGWTVMNNKGKAVRQFEPFFTDLSAFEFDVRIGSSPVIFYDPAERVLGRLRPDHTWEKSVFDAWRQETWDVNDTVLAGDPSTDADLGDFFARLPSADYLPSWYDARSGGALGSLEQTAAEKAAVHAESPTVAHLDSLGRTFLSIAHNKFKYSNTPPANPPTEEFYPARTLLDIEGNEREVRDAVVQNADVQGRVIMRYAYDMEGHRIYQVSMESGERWMLNDVTGKSIRSWDSRAHTMRTEHDELRRPIRLFVTGADPANPTQEFMTERLIYGEQHPNGLQLNMLGAVYLHLDQAGAGIDDEYDFKGNLLSGSRRLAQDYRNTVDWGSVDAVVPAAPATFNQVALDAAIGALVEATTYTSTTEYDALNRPTALTAPDTSIVRPRYNEANLLEVVEVNVRGAMSGGSPVWTAFVKDIDYNARGQRTRIEYDSGVITDYTYDPVIFRLTHKTTTRDASYNPNERVVQDLSYTYDAIGNITHIQDDADIQNVVFFRNQRVDPSSDYLYDATYRLIEATGREHLGLTGGGALQAATQPGDSDAPRWGIVHPGDGKAVGTYSDRYEYDAVGNLLTMIHSVASGGWTRYYGYSEASLTEAGKTNNRLSATSLPGDNPAGPYSCTYTHDDHGNMTTMPHLPLMQWDYHDRLQATSKQVVMSGTPETTWYVYDAGGRRMRKVTDWQAAANVTPNRKAERIYIGLFEVYREYDASGSVVQLERETLHVMDQKHRIAMVETKTIDVGVPPATLPETLYRYQFSNQVDSASLELDEKGGVITYEEYFPFGSTSYEAARSTTEAAKRYRYTGQERDEETGLNYHAARYYVPWLGRWSAADPGGLVDGENLFRYARNNPVKFNDPNGMQTPQGHTAFTPSPLGQRETGLTLSNLRLSIAPYTFGSATGLTERGVNLSASGGFHAPGIGLKGTGQINANFSTLRSPGGLTMSQYSVGGSGKLQSPFPMHVGFGLAGTPGRGGAPGQATLTAQASSFGIARVSAQLDIQTRGLQGNFGLSANARLFGLKVASATGSGSYSFDRTGFNATTSFKAKALGGIGFANGTASFNSNKFSAEGKFGLNSPLFIRGTFAVTPGEGFEVKKMLMVGPIGKILEMPEVPSANVPGWFSTAMGLANVTLPGAMPKKDEPFSQTFGAVGKLGDWTLKAGAVIQQKEGVPLGLHTIHPEFKSFDVGLGFEAGKHWSFEGAASFGQHFQATLGIKFNVGK
ncbi:MAG: toxin [Bacteroidetes bacterium]|nr:toxin [Bacteroidota bacterium]